MRKLALIFALMAARALACNSGYISIVDPYLLPNGSPWTGTITYTLLYPTTVNGATVQGTISTQNVTNGLNLCLVSGIYSVTSVQSGYKPVTSQWGVPNAGGPYTIGQISGSIVLSIITPNTFVCPGGQHLTSVSISSNGTITGACS